MIKTYQELVEMDSLVARLYQEDPTLRKGKFAYAYQKFYTNNVTPVQTEMREKLEDIRVDNAMVDSKTGELLYCEPTPGQQKGDFKYDKEGMKALNSATRDLIKEFQDKEVEIKPYFSSVVPANLSLEDLEALYGCIIEVKQKSKETPKKKKNA